MGALEGFVAAMCAFSPGGGTTACQSAMNATTRQVTVDTQYKVPDIIACQRAMNSQNPRKEDLDACLRAGPPAETHVNFQDEANGTENKIQAMALTKSIDMLGRDTVYGVGGAAFAAKAYVDKKFTVDVPSPVLCDKIHLDSDFNQSTYGLRLQWNFK